MSARKVLERPHLRAAVDAQSICADRVAGDRRYHTCNCPPYCPRVCSRLWPTGSEAFSWSKSSPSATAKGTSAQATASAPVAAVANPKTAENRPGQPTVDQSGSARNPVLGSVHAADWRARDQPETRRRAHEGSISADAASDHPTAGNDSR